MSDIKTLSKCNPRNEKTHSPQKQFEIIQAKLKRELKLKTKLPFSKTLLLEQAASLTLELWRLQKESVIKKKALESEYYRASQLLQKTLIQLGIFKKVEPEKEKPKQDNFLSSVINNDEND